MSTAVDLTSYYYGNASYLKYSLYHEIGLQSSIHEEWADFARNGLKVTASLFTCALWSSVAETVSRSNVIVSESEIVHILKPRLPESVTVASFKVNTHT